MPSKTVLAGKDMLAAGPVRDGFVVLDYAVVVVPQEWNRYSRFAEEPKEEVEQDVGLDAVVDEVGLFVWKALPQSRHHHH